MQATACTTIKPHRGALDRSEAAKCETLQQNIAEWMYPCVVPDNAHRSRRITDSDTWEILRLPIEAGNTGSQHRHDIDWIARCRTVTTCGGQCQTGEGYGRYHIFRW